MADLNLCACLPMYGNGTTLSYLKLQVSYNREAGKSIPPFLVTLTPCIIEIRFFYLPVHFVQASKLTPSFAIWPKSPSGNSHATWFTLDQKSIAIYAHESTNITTNNGELMLMQSYANPIFSSNAILHIVLHTVLFYSLKHISIGIVMQHFLYM